jgi:hypothetical protein
LRKRSASLATLAALATILLALCGATSASAEVVNGDFENGNLEGWQVESSGEFVEWSKFSGEFAGMPPLSGKFFAGTAIEESGTTILYQDVTLPPASTSTLGMTLLYESQDPIVVPNPPTLDAQGPFDNQQFRADVIKPTAAPDSLAPSDILATVFATSEAENHGEANAEPSMEPKRFSTDLSAFAGQTVRLRFAAATTGGFEALFAGVDAVTLTSAPLPPPAPAPPAPAPAPIQNPSNLIVKGKLTLHRRSGTGTLAVTVPAAGTLTAMDANRKIAIASQSAGAAARRQPPAKPALIRTATLHPSAAGTIKLPIKPTAAGLRALRETGKLRFRARLTFTPDGGTAATQVYKNRLLGALSARR